MDKGPETCVSYCTIRILFGYLFVCLPYLFVWLFVCLFGYLFRATITGGCLVLLIIYVSIEKIKY
jgi:hypothetical protein